MQVGEAQALLNLAVRLYPKGLMMSPLILTKGCLQEPSQVSRLAPWSSFFSS